MLKLLYSIMSKEKILSHKLFLQQEDAVFHLSYDNEMSFYDAVKNGDFEKVKTLMKPLTAEGLGVLSNNPIRNLKYHLIITIAFITRFCIEGGMNPEVAYTLSDIYIQQLDNCSLPEEIEALHREAIFDYTDRMLKIKKRIGYSKIVINVADYIYNHLNEKLSLDDLTKEFNINKSYLCELFKKETGLTINNYIHKLKIDAAKKMLIYSDYSPIDISNYFCFSSHSHFISIFKKFTKMTPNEYKKRNYRSYLSNRKSNNNPL